MVISSIVHYNYDYLHLSNAVGFRSRIGSQGTHNQITGLNITSVVDGQIVYMQSKDYIVKGKGSLAVTDDGIGAPFVTLQALSGKSEDIYRNVEIYGIPAPRTGL